MKHFHRKTESGLLSIELLVTVAVMVVLFGVLATVGGAFKKVNDYRWTRHVLIAAGQSQMDAIAATGRPIDEQTFRRLWPKVQCTVDITEGEGPWQGLQKVRLQLSAKSRQSVIEIFLIRYMPKKEETP